MDMLDFYIRVVKALDEIGAPYMDKAHHRPAPRGHMSLHAWQAAIAAGASGELIEKVCADGGRKSGEN